MATTQNRSRKVLFFNFKLVVLLEEKSWNSSFQEHPFVKFSIHRLSSMLQKFLEKVQALKFVMY